MFGLVLLCSGVPCQLCLCLAVPLVGRNSKWDPRKQITFAVQLYKIDFVPWGLLAGWWFGASSSHLLIFLSWGKLLFELTSRFGKVHWLSANITVTSWVQAEMQTQVSDLGFSRRP